MNLNRIVKAVALTTIFAILPSSLAQLSGHSQSSDGKVKGVTTDQWGAVIPNVTVVFEGAGLRREVKSHEGTGEFELMLPAGEYRVLAESEAFHPYRRKKLRVEASKTRKLKVRLKSKYPPITE